MARRPLLPLIVVLGLGLGACGWGTARDNGNANDPGSVEDVVADAAASLTERRSGEVRFALRASAEGTDAVGFDVEGPYSFDSPGELAVIDLTYALVLGPTRTETRVVSTGDEAWVVTDGATVSLDEEEAVSLRLGDAGAPVVSDLDLASWVADGEVETDGDDTTVTGDLDVLAFLADLQNLASEVGGQPALEPVDEEAAEGLEAQVRDREIVLETEGSDHRLRSLSAVIDFGAAIPDRLREVLGQFAGARLQLDLEVDELDGPLEVEALS